MSRPKFDEVRVGDAIPANISQTVSQDMINRWASVSVDFNPLHVDPEFGKASQFGCNISHGTLTITYIMEMMTRWLGNAWLNGGELEGMKFVSPVKSGDTVKPGGTVTGKRAEGNRNLIECDVWLEKQDGTKAIVGKAISPLP